MIKIIKIDTIDQVKEILFDQKQNEKIGRYRSSYLYRGMSNSNYHLVTSLSRNCGEKSQKLEHHLLENFIKYASIEDPSIKESQWKAMIVGQHHGLPTRLLDWTHSSLVALHFANTESNLNDLNEHDCIIWRIDANELKEKLPEKYKSVLEENETFMFSISTFEKVAKSIEDYDLEMKNNSLVLIEPPSIDQRIVNQYSFFSIIPSGITNIEDFLENNTSNTIKYIISKDLRWQIRDTLDQLNMSERMIYPGLDGISKWLARHYYFKNDER